MNPQSEVRFALGLELRSGNAAATKTIVGYAAVFNSPSEELRLASGRAFREIVRPGAFTESLRSRHDVVARFDHAGLLGRVSNGTLRLIEDTRGLRYEIDLPNTQAARDLVELVRRGDVFGSSFEFRVRPGGDVWSQGGPALTRELRNVELLEISPVVRPAYPATDVALRSLDAWQASPLNTYRTRLELAERSLKSR